MGGNVQSNAPVQKTGLVNGIAASPDANCAIPISFTDSRTNGAYKAPICNYRCDKEASCPSTVQVLYSQEVMRRLLEEGIGPGLAGRSKEPPADTLQTTHSKTSSTSIKQSVEHWHLTMTVSRLARSSVTARDWHKEPSKPVAANAHTLNPSAKYPCQFSAGICRPSINDKRLFRERDRILEFSVTTKTRQYLFKRVHYFRPRRVTNVATLPRIDALRGNIQFQGIPTPTPRYLLKIGAEFSLGVLGCTTHLLNDGDTAALTARIQMDDFVNMTDTYGKQLARFIEDYQVPLRALKLPARRYAIPPPELHIRDVDFPAISRYEAVRQNHYETKTRNQRSSDNSNAPKDAARFPTVSRAQNTPKLDPLNREHSVPARCF
ncbi:hypothetical protein EV421DRAFT_1979983 [Armillaria borealis]|uniref:Uncharacterized protein n=1 Tax=Armillaria borealis TaxID=47425 RepID=A0AA39J6Z5_9AGAR|nr:hypothetical protein EV421DRAFT_1979983 [Armillaria borealis]